MAKGAESSVAEKAMQRAKRATRAAGHGARKIIATFSKASKSD